MASPHEIARITIRYVWSEGYFWRERRSYYPSCRGGHRRKDCQTSAYWNIRFSYKSLSVRGGGQSMYWCDMCLPTRYRAVADSMLRDKEKVRVLRGEALETVSAALDP